MRRVALPLCALVLTLCELGARVCPSKLRLGARDFGRVRAGIDVEQRVTLPNDRALRERDALDESGDAWADLHRVDGFEVAGELVPVGHHFPECRGDRHLRRWRSRCRLAACRQHETSHGDADAEPLTAATLLKSALALVTPPRPTRP